MRYPEISLKEIFEETNLAGADFGELERVDEEYRENNFFFEREREEWINELLGEGSLPQGRVLTYSQKDVIDNRIGVPAQHSLVRLSKNPATSADAVGMLEAVKSGKLAGIYCVNWKVAAERAKRLGTTWNTVIPKREDAVLMLDPDNLSLGPPLIAFRRELDPRKDGCGSLKTDKSCVPSPARLDRGLIRVWCAYVRFRNREIQPCVPYPPGMYAELEQNETRDPIIPLCCPAQPIKPVRSKLLTLITYAAGFRNPYESSPYQERIAVTRGVWFPSSVDFQQTAAHSGARNSVRGVSNFSELLNFIDRQEERSIDKLYVIGHSGPDAFCLSGFIGPNNMPKVQAGDVVCVADDSSITISSIAHNLQRIQGLRNRFREQARIVLVGCNAGVNPRLLDKLAIAFQVCVNGFRSAVCHCIIWHTAKNRITRIDRGRVAYPPNDPDELFGLRMVLNDSCRVIPPSPAPSCERQFHPDVTRLQPDLEYCPRTSI